MFKKNMKKGLSVLLSLAMVVTSVTINGKKADAADGVSDLAVVAFDETAPILIEKTAGTGDLTGKISVVEGKTETLADDKLEVKLYEGKWDNTANGFVADLEKESTEAVSVGTASVTDDGDDKAFTVTVTVTDEAKSGAYVAVAEYTDTAEEIATASKVFYVEPEYKVAFESESFD